MCSLTQLTIKQYLRFSKKMICESRRRLEKRRGRVKPLQRPLTNPMTMKPWMLMLIWKEVVRVMSRRRSLQSLFPWPRRVVYKNCAKNCTYGWLRFEEAEGGQKVVLMVRQGVEMSYWRSVGDNEGR